MSVCLRADPPGLVTPGLCADFIPLGSQAVLESPVYCLVQQPVQTCLGYCIHQRPFSFSRPGAWKMTQKLCVVFIKSNEQSNLPCFPFPLVVFLQQEGRSEPRRSQGSSAVVLCWAVGLSSAHWPCCEDVSDIDLGSLCSAASPCCSAHTPKAVSWLSLCCGFINQF